MYNQFNNRNYNISIIQNVSYVVTIIEVISIFLKIFFFVILIGHSSSMCFIDRIVLQICKPPHSIHTTLRASQLEHENETKKSDAHRTKSMVMRLAEFVPLLHSTHWWNASMCALLYKTTLCTEKHVWHKKLEHTKTGTSVYMYIFYFSVSLFLGSDFTETETSAYIVSVAVCLCSLYQTLLKQRLQHIYDIVSIAAVSYTHLTLPTRRWV